MEIFKHKNRIYCVKTVNTSLKTSTTFFTKRDGGIQFYSLVDRGGNTMLFFEVWGIISNSLGGSGGYNRILG